jgi:hypothetical protein
MQRVASGGSASCSVSMTASGAETEKTPCCSN